MKILTQSILLIFLIVAKSFAVVSILPDNSEIQYTGVVEKINGSSGMELYRFKKSYIDNKTTGGLYLWKTAATQAGVTISIKTSSPTVAFNFTLDSEYTDFGYSVMVLYRDGVEVKSVSGGNGSLSISGTVSAAESAVWTVILPGLKSQFFNNIQIDDGYTIEPLEKSTLPAYVAIGNSITHGIGQTGIAGNKSYSWLVAQGINHELYNLGIGGSRIYGGVVDNLEDLNPSVISVLWGFNDMTGPGDLLDGNPEMPWIKAGIPEYEVLMTRLVTEYPEAKIFAIEQTYTKTIGGSTVPANTVARLRSEQLKVIEELQKTHDNLFFIASTDYTTAASLSDNVHLNNQGAQDLANGMITEIKAVLDNVTESVHGVESAQASIQISISGNALSLMNLPLDMESGLIMNLQGEIIRSIPSTNKAYQVVDVSNISHGVYLLKIQSGSGVITQTIQL